MGGPESNKFEFLGRFAKINLNGQSKHRVDTNVFGSSFPQFSVRNTINALRQIKPEQRREKKDHVSNAKKLLNLDKKKCIGRSNPGMTQS
jgi:hypothetical protein